MSITLRDVTPADHAPLLEMVTAPSVAEWWGRWTVEQLREWLGEDGVTAWAIVVDGALAGLIVLDEEREDDYQNVDVDLFVADGLQGRGIGPEAIRRALATKFEEGHHRATIYPAAANARAIRAYEKVGFRPVGILRKAEKDLHGEWRDDLVMDLLAEEMT